MIINSNQNWFSSNKAVDLIFHNLAWKTWDSKTWIQFQYFLPTQYFKLSSFIFPLRHSFLKASRNQIIRNLKFIKPCTWKSLLYNLFNRLKVNSSCQVLYCLLVSVWRWLRYAVFRLYFVMISLSAIIEKFNGVNENWCGKS